MKKQGATFRDFIANIRAECKMAELKKPASLKLELAGVMAAFDGKPVYTEKVKETSDLSGKLAPMSRVSRTAMMFSSTVSLRNMDGSWAR